MKMRSARAWFHELGKTEARPARPRVETLEDRLVPAVQAVSAAAGASGAANGTANGTSVATNLGSISDDGRYIVFASDGSNLVAGQTDANHADDVFLYDTVAHVTTLISHAVGSPYVTGDAKSYMPTISGDGKWVAFVSEATNLIGGVNVDGDQVYMYDVVNNALALVTYSAGSTTDASNGWLGTATALPSLSHDGRYLGFISDATNLVVGFRDGHDSNSLSFLNGQPAAHAYLYDRSASGSGAIRLVSHVPANLVKGGNEDATQIAVSGDGSAVAFTSFATNLGQIEDRFSTSPDVFRYDIATGTVSLATYDASAGDTRHSGASESDTDFSPPSISADGRYIVYASHAASLVPGQVDAGISAMGFTIPDLDTFVYDAVTGSTTLVSRQIGTTATAAGGDLSATANNRPVISADGKWIAFVSPANSLVSPAIDSGSNDNVYLYEVATGAVTLVSHATSPSLPISGDSPTISRDGGFVAFAAPTTAPDIYRFRRDTGALNLYSPAFNAGSSTSGDLPSGGINSTPSISGDGTTIAWNGAASNLVANDNNADIDVFMNGQIVPTITVEVPAYVYDGSSYSITALVTGLYNTVLGTPSLTYYLDSDPGYTNPLSGPPSSDGNYVVVASYPGGGNYLSSSKTARFSIVDAAVPPQVLAVAAFVGPTSGGNVVVITGAGFSAIEPGHSAAAVKFGAVGSFVNAASYTVISNSQITAVAPAGSISTVNVVVTTPNGSTADDATNGLAGSTANDYTYAAPAVTSVTINGGDIVARNSFGAAPSLIGQQSVVEQILVAFNMPVTLDANAFTIASLAAGVNASVAVPAAAPIGVTATGVPASHAANGTGYSQYVLTFDAGPGVNSVAVPQPNGGTSAFTTLKDGFFQLNTIGSRVHAGASDTAADRTDRFWSLYGAVHANDITAAAALGDGHSNLLVDGIALGGMYAAFGSFANGASGPAYQMAYDSNLDGMIDGIDLSRMYANFGTIWQF